jgi:hypothetical protein
MDADDCNLAKENIGNYYDPIIYAIEPHSKVCYVIYSELNQFMIFEWYGYKVF